MQLPPEHEKPEPNREQCPWFVHDPQLGGVHTGSVEGQ